MRSQSILVHGRAMGKHKLTRFTMTWTCRKPPPSPLQYIMCLTTRPTPKCHFLSRLPSGSPEIPKIGTPMTLGAHNFVFRPLIEIRFEVRLQPLLKSFQQYLANNLQVRKLGRFLTFNGRESNWQFDSQPFFWP